MRLSFVFLPRGNWKFSLFVSYSASFSFSCFIFPSSDIPHKSSLYIHVTLVCLEVLLLQSNPFMNWLYLFLFFCFNSRTLHHISMHVSIRTIAFSLARPESAKVFPRECEDVYHCLLSRFLFASRYLQPCWHYSRVRWFASTVSL